MREPIRDEVAKLISAGMRAAQDRGALPRFDLPSVVVERPRQAGHGDYASPICMQLAREIRMPPREIAAQAIAHIPNAPFVGEVEVAGPGYINVTLDSRWLAQQILQILADGDQWGNVDIGSGRRVQVEFVSANPTGPMTVASTRNAVIGDVVASVLEAAGYDVEREYYVNDAGSQVRKFGESIFARYAEALEQEVPFPEDGYQGQYVADMGQLMARQYGDRFLKVPRQQALHALGNEGIRRMLVGIRRDLSALGVEFDTWFHEKTLHESGLLDKVLGILKDGGYIVERDGAVWFTSDDLEADAVVIRSPRVIPELDERPTYFASDIAYMWHKLVDRGFDEATYVWGADHHGDVPRVKAAAPALGLDPDRLKIIIYQMVNLKRGGKDVRMSKRKGEFITLRDLLEEVGPDPIRFMLLTRTVDATVDFDLDLAVEQSEKNPVYYVQYAHARNASILRHAAGLGWDAEVPGDIFLLAHPSELALIRKMLVFQEVVTMAAVQRAPHHLTFYAQELSSAFHSFYADCRVVDAEQPALTRARLTLVRAIKLSLAQALGLIGVTAPERM